MSEAEPGSPPRLRTLLALAWPIVVSRSTQVVIGICDALLVAGLGEEALAAATTGGLNVFVLFILPMGLVFIVSSFSSQLFGKGDLAGARRYGFYGLGVALLTEIACVLSLPAIDPVLARLPYAPGVSQLVGDYLRIRLLSGGAAIGMEALANYYGGLGNTRLPMRASLAAMVLNVIGCVGLVGGRLGLPAMGVRGTALASALATTIAFLGLLARFLLDGRAVGRIVPQLHLREATRMLRFGLPSGFNWFFEFFAFTFFVNVVVAGLGTTSLAAFMAVMQVNQFSFMPAFGLASAGAILVGQAIGAGARDAVPRIVRLTFIVTAVWQGTVGLVYLVFPATVFSAFVREGATGPTLLATGAHFLMLSAAWQLFDAAATTVAEALRAAGDTAYTLWVRLVLAWVVFAPGSYITVRYLGWRENGAILWLVIYLGGLAAILFVRFRGGAWRNLRLTEGVVLE